MSSVALKTVRENVRRLLKELPPGVELVAVAKGAEPGAVLEAMEAGATAIGESYVQEAARHAAVVGRRARWHFIGRLQKNKVKKAAALFDTIESIDSAGIAAELDRQCERLGRVMPVLIEVNSAREPQKSGAFPEQVEALARRISTCGHLRLMGLMTIGPRSEEPDGSRAGFAETRRIFERLKDAGIPGVEMKYLSMGMTGSYRVAIEEGANIVRIGTAIFGERV
jgi:pyridoxal phosphate enzyme (YggS family)